MELLGNSGHFLFVSTSIARSRKRRCRRRALMESMSWFWQDLRYGARSLRKDRGFSLLAMFALALGIGATTVIFSVLDNVLLEPFLYKSSDRLTSFFVHDNSRSAQEGRGGFFVSVYLVFKVQNPVFEG